MRNGIDFHSHIIPAADHGCLDASESAEQLSLLRSAGMERVVATPHFYPTRHEVNTFLQTVNTGVSALRAQTDIAFPQLHLGAEVLLCPGIHRMPDFDRLCIRGTRILLLELPFSGCNNELFDTVMSIIRRGYAVVLAHIDRYLPQFADQIDNLLRCGAMAQVNVSALRGFFSRKRLMPYLKQDCLVALGSDLHGTDPKFVAGFENAQKLPDDIFGQIMERSSVLLRHAEVF